jgi:hypothetical protein
MEKRLYFIIGDLIANALVGPTVVSTQRWSPLRSSQGGAY